MLTKIVELCNKRGVIFSTRVSIDGVGDMHNDVRHVKNGFNKANETIRAMRELQKKFSFNFGISTTIFSQNLDDAENILAWARNEKLDIVFNMVRFTDAMLGNADLSDTCKPLGPKEEQMRQFFLDRVRMDPLLDGQNYIYMHYADMIANGYHRLSPCPFQTQGIMLNPDGGLFFCENSDVVGNVLTEDAEELYFKASSQEHRDWVKEKKCPTLPEPVPDERGGGEAGGAVREVPRARVAREAETPREGRRSGCCNRLRLGSAGPSGLPRVSAFPPDKYNNASR